jgi:predicted DNA-binding protein (MmcQ/YjbR family)
VDLTTISKKQEIDDLITESWYEVTENLSKKKRELLNKN